MSEPVTTDTQAAPATTASETPATAAAAHAEAAPPAQEPAAQAPAETAQEQAAQPATAAAAHANPAQEEKPQEEKPADADLSAMTDDDYAKIVQPDVEGEEVDRSLITPMAKELRAAGIQPNVMAKIAPIYRKAVDDAIAKDKEARAERMKALNAECEKQVTAEEWKNFAAAWSDHIKGDAELERIFSETELGSNPRLIKLIALAGATLRVEGQPPATASAGSGQTNLEQAVFERTVPKDLR